jgi:acetolactate synthase-1/2/3 large subunit
VTAGADGGELLVEVLRGAGVDTAFGIVSIHNLPLVQAVQEHLRFVPVRHEAAAVSAADGYARSRGGLGCAITSTGTGAGNAAGSLVEALTASTPILHVTGQIPTRYLGQGRGFIHETRDQHAMLAAVSRRCLLVAGADTARGTLVDAVTEALGLPGGPVSVEWPIDLQYLVHPPSGTTGDFGSASEDGEAAVPRAADGRRLVAVAGGLQARCVTGTEAVVDVQAVTDATEILVSARRPAIWIGGGGRRAGRELLELVERIGAAVFTSNAGRGAIPEDHELCVGNYATMPAGQALLDEADVLLSVGTHFRSNETATYGLRVPAAHVQIDVDPDAIGRVYPVKVGVVGEAGAVVTTIAGAVRPGAADRDWRQRVVAAREEVRREHRAHIGAQVVICDAIRTALPRRGIVARDVTIPSSSWGNRLLPIYHEQDNLFAHGGGIGQGLAMGIGAAVGRPGTPAVVIVGDGGLVVHLGELYTLAQEQLPVTVVVFNDGGYGVLRNLQQAHGLPAAGVDLLAPDLELVARSAGLAYHRVDDPATVADVLSAAIGAGGPSLVEVDVVAIGPMTTPFVPPVEAIVPGDEPS